MRSDEIHSALLDIHEHIELSTQFVESLDAAAFLSDKRTIYAVTRCLEIISEASRRLSAETKARHTQINWRDIAAAGNIYRHDYEAVLPSAIWNTVTLALPPLLAAVEQEPAVQAPSPG